MSEQTLPAQVRAHHPYSPSTLQAREACPKYAPQSAETAASLAGTRQHNAVENAEDSPLLGDHEALAVAECLAYADNVAKKYPGGIILKEEYLPIDDEVIRVPLTDPEKNPFEANTFVGTTAGYPDFVIVSKDGMMAEIIDWKFGKQAVESAENNLQGMAYLLGVLRRFPNLKQCTVQFVLPHRDEVDFHTFSLTEDFKQETYLRIKTIVARAIQAAKNPDDFSSANPVVSACLFCGLIGKCPKVAERVLKISQKFAPLQMPENVSPTLILDPADTSYGIKMAQIAKTWAEAFRAAATDKAVTDPSFIPEGYILVSMQRRKIVDALKAAELAKEFLPSDKAAEIDKLLDIPISGVEELIELVSPRGQKSSQVEAFAKILQDSGAIEMGNPYAILRLSSKKKTKQ